MLWRSSPSVKSIEGSPMAFNRVAGCVFLFVLLAGALSAITNVTTASQSNFARWSPTYGPASITTQGGNISWINITAAYQLTAKWADLFGTVTGANIILAAAGDTTNYVYRWNATSATKGVVCVSEGSSFPSSTLSSANLTDINGLWSLTTIDNATNTYNTTFTSVNISSQTLFNANGSRLQGQSTFTDAAIYNGTTGSKGNYAFCTNISSSGKNYNNVAVNYELLVPTTPSSTETYNLYLEIQT